MKEILIIGYGSIGRRHHEVLTNLYPHARIDIVSSHEISRDGFYTSIDDVPYIQEYEYFIIASKTVNHFSDLSKVCRLTTGKLVLVEKPLFSTFNNSIDWPGRIYVGYNLRFHPILQRMKMELEGRKILTMNVYTGQYLPSWRPGTDYTKSYSSSRTEGGGVLLDLSHELDYIQWLGGAFIRLKAINRKISSLEINSDDVMTMIGETDSGVIVTITLDYLSMIPQRRIIVQTDNGTMIADLIEGKFEEHEHESERREEFKNVDRNYTYREMHKSIGTDDSSLCTLEDGLSVMRTIEMIKDSEKMDW